jgi:hypothetical protein
VFDLPFPMWFGACRFAAQERLQRFHYDEIYQQIESSSDFIRFCARGERLPLVADPLLCCRMVAEDWSGRRHSLIWN